MCECLNKLINGLPTPLNVIARSGLPGGVASVRRHDSVRSSEPSRSRYMKRRCSSEGLFRSLNRLEQIVHRSKPLINCNKQTAQLSDPGRAVDVIRRSCCNRFLARLDRDRTVMQFARLFKPGLKQGVQAVESSGVFWVLWGVSSSAFSLTSTAQWRSSLAPR